MAQPGFEYPFEPDRRVVTIFTASNYMGEFQNKAAFLTIAADFVLTVNILDRKAPHITIEPEQPQVAVRRPPTARGISAIGRPSQKSKRSTGRRMSTTL
jgi:hypothetical protein